MTTKDLGTDNCKKAVSQANIAALKELTGLDDYTLKDILDSIMRPLRDYRDDYDGPILRQDILTLEDLHVHDKLEGTVRNVVDFGAFVDIGLHEDGLVHISKMSKNRIKHPSDVVSVGDIVTTWVYTIDEQRHKVQLTMIDPNK
ncbi:30S ribosomal protein S1 [Roseburia hominis]|nr:30S ribosomal protein S1 [Roseburia hominis]